MVNCAVKLCRNYTTKNIPGVTFLNFPKDPQLKRKWVDALKREDDWIPTKHSRVCSIHFDESAYDITDKGLKRLHKDAVPVKHLYLEDIQRQSSPDQPESPHSQLSEPLLKRKMAAKIRTLQYTVGEQKKKIKVLNNKVRRHKIKISNLEIVIEQLQHKHFLSDCEGSVLNTASIQAQ